ncbi:MAG TPA: VTT domain-containing protein [Acidobacteriaceae bacterium]
MFVKIGPIALLHKFSAMLFAVMKPLGVWGVGGLAFIDSALIPIPVSMDGVVIGYVATNHSKFFIYCLIAAAASAIGSLVPFFIGRAGGELFLLKRINRQRYERIRDRFENQEFLAMMIPAMCPPPFPLKLFEFAAGVFEMKPLLFMLALFCGKLIQFVVCSLLYIWFGPKLFHDFREAFHTHAALTTGIIVGALFLIALYIVRRVFDRRRGLKLPLEEAEDAGDPQTELHPRMRRRDQASSGD